MAKRALDRAKQGDLRLFDERPMELDGFKFKSRTVEVIGRPTLGQFAAALDIALACGDGSPYWIGELWNYGEGRADWRDKLEQAIRSSSAYTHKTLINLGYIVRNTSAKARDLAPSVGHVSEVASLEQDEQEEWMERASSEGLTVRDLRLEIKASRRRKVIEGRAVLDGKYRVIYADPPWIYGDRPPSGSGAGQHYDGMTIAQLCELPIAQHAADDAVLFVWTTAPLILENPGVREVIEAWGFTYKTCQIWDKVLPAGGYYVAVRHEILLIATRGSCTPDHPVPMPPSVITERQIGEHSAKPASFRTQIEKMYEGPYLELFGREAVSGWSVFGNDAALWAGSSAIARVG